MSNSRGTQPPAPLSRRRERRHRERKGGSRVKNLTEKIAAIRERRERYKDMLAELDQTGESQISLTDPDSRAMAAALSRQLDRARIESEGSP